MRFPLLVIAAACAATPSVAVQAAVAPAPDNGFRRQAALPKWALPLGQIPATTRTDPMVVRLTETQAWVGATPATLYNRAIQVNDSSELGTIGQIGLDYFSAYQKLILHRVAILRDGRTIDHTATASARALQRETAMESGMMGGATTLQLLLDDVRIGDTLWLTYTIEGENPVFGKTWSGDFSWDSGAPTERRLLTVMHPASRPLQWRQLGDFRADQLVPKIERAGDIERLRFEGRAIEPVEGEPRIPSDYLPVRLLQFSEYRDWQEVARWADGLFPKNKPSPALTALVRQFAREPDPAARAAAALRWVQQEVRYFSVSIGENSHRPQVPDVVLKRRYGDCKDKSYLLVSLLSEMGIEARPALLSASAPKLPARMLASPMWFNHVVVQIRIDGRDYYVDPTSARQPEPLALIPGSLPGAAALLVERASTALVTLPPRTDTLPHHELVQNIEVADFDGAATMETRDIFRGSYADRARLRYPTMSVNEQKKAMLASYEKRYPGITLAEAPVLQDFPAENRYEIRTRYRMPKAVSQKDTVYGIDYDPQLIDDTLGVPDKIVRNFPLELPAGKFRGRYRLNVTWPATVRADERPYSNTVDNAYFRAHEEYTFRGNVVNYLMDYRIKAPSVAAGEMPAFHAETKRLDAFSGGRFKVPGAFLSTPELVRYSPRELDSLRNGRALYEASPEMARKKDAEIDSDEACRFISLSAGIEDIVGAEVMRQARRLEKVVTANQAQPSARLCLASLAFARGQYAQGAALYRAEAATLKDDSRAVRNLAWAALYANDADAAVAAMARYRAARAADPAGLASNTDLVDQIALLQRAGKPLPADAARTAAEIPDGPWPRPLLAMQAGLVTPAALVQAAEALQGDARAYALTEAWFYIGQSHLARKDAAAARQAFQAIATHGIRSSELYPQALGELQRLAPSDSQFKAGVNAFKDKNAAAARGQWDQGAAAGDANAIIALASLALGADGGPKDLPKAVVLLEQAAALGHPRAQSILGDFYSEGTGVKADPKRSFGYYLTGAELGDADAQAALGYCYRNSYGVARDDAKSVYWYSRAVQRGHLGAAAELGRAYQYAWGVPQDLQSALQMYTAAAEAGNAKAQHYLGYMYRQGDGVAKDLSRAAGLYRKSAAQGYREGQSSLGYALMQGEGVRKDVVEGLVQLHKAAEQGSANAQSQIGFAYEKGHGVTKDYIAARTWYLKAAEQNDSTAEYSIGMIYRHGKGAEKDPAESFKWFLRAAEHGDTDAESIVAEAYRYGKGVARDPKAALTWYERASDRGETASQVELGKMLIGGHVPKDEKKAFKLFELAAAKGDESALYQLGMCYEDGAGVAVNLEKAATAYLAAAADILGARNRLFIMYEDGRLPGPDRSGNAKALAEAAKRHDTSMQVSLGEIYIKQGKLAKAQAAYESALRISEQGPFNEEDMSDILDSLASVLTLLDRHVEAHAMKVRLLALHEKTNNRDHIYNLGAMTAVADGHAAQGEYDKAEDLYQRVLAVQQNVLGADSVKTVSALWRLADLHRKRQRYVQSEPLFVRALALTERALPKSHSLATGFNNLGLLYCDMGRFDEADALFARAMALRESLLGPDHAELSISLQNYGILYARQKKYAQAEASFKRALAIVEREFGKQHAETADVLNEYGFMLSQKGALAEAEAMYTRALAIRERGRNAASPLVRDTRSKLAALYRKTNRASEAAALEKSGGGTS